MAKYAVVLASFLFIVSCGRGVESPTAPGTTTTTLALSAGTLIGNNQQLTATLVATDGTVVDVTTTAIWRSMDPTVATVSNAGLVTVLTDGTADIQATYKELSSTLRVGSNTVRYSITGQVSAAFPGKPNLVPNVKVEIVTGLNTGAFAITDTSGNYAIRDLQAGAVGMRILATGYQSWSQDLVLSGDTIINPVLTQISALLGLRRP